jgi:hypothetical protein
VPAWALVDDLTVGLRLLRGLPGYLRRPLTLDECRQIVTRRLASRAADFLALARDAIYANPVSPYLALLRRAGCAYGDLERLVRADGVEGALRTLLREGVYLTVDEFRGRQPAVRGSATIEIDPVRLRNPLATPHYWGTTSGSRGAPARLPMDLTCLRDWAVDLRLSLAARGGAGWRTAVWGTPGVVPVLWYSAGGGPAARWFSVVDPTRPGLHPRYRWSVRAIRWASRLWSLGLPELEHVPVDAPLPIARWMAETLRAGAVPHLWAFPSSAMRVCQAAEDAGLSVAGAQLTITGEPVTAARLAALRRFGVHAVPDYGSADSGGSVTHGCLAPAAPDDVHLFHDLNALVQAEAPPFPAGALLVSSLRPTVPLILLNTSMGDRATVVDRRCGCPMETLGWRTHLHTIRSYEKLTAGGMTFVDTDVVRILEEVLPRRFGGSPLDYQLIEEEEAMSGRPRLRLLVHPAVGPLDPAAVIRVFLEAIGTGNGAERIMAHQWAQGGLLRVEREAPLAAPSGKVLHLWTAR